MTASDNNLRLAFNVDTGKFPGMDNQELFDVRHFSVREDMSGFFEVNLVAVADDPDIPLEAFVGRAGAFRAQTTNGNTHPVRVWAGICSNMSHLHAADPGVSSYHFTIVPLLWRTTLRKNSRIYQHLSTPDIVKALLAEWQITATWQLTATYKAHEYCVQYGETDHSFMCRLLEDAGISYYFTFNATSGKGADIVGLVFDDAPHQARANNTRKGPLQYAGTQTPDFGATSDFCSNISITQRVRPGTSVIRDFDFRLPPTLNLSAQVTLGGSSPEDVYEQYQYSPGEFLWEPGKGGATKPLADKYSQGKPAGSVADADKAALVAISLAAERRRQLLVSFQTNSTDLRPGLLVSVNQESSGVHDHPRSDLPPDRKILVVGTNFDGEHNGEWSMTVTAVFTEFPLRPEQITPKPRIYGVQSAIVVGPPGQEIYTDEFGRVRVQFHWDREGKYDDKSSCWMRVTQAWAGGGFGAITIPRVGNEVIVQFFEGNPDLPIIVGRVYNLSSPVPYPLPASQTVSGLKSNSSPGGGGFNEIKFDDQKGSELIHVQAQQMLTTVVNASETRDIGGTRATKIKGSEQINIGGDHMTVVGSTDITHVGSIHAVSVGKTTGSKMTDKHVLFSTGGASIEMVNGEIFINATGGIHIHANTGVELTTKSKDITIQGGKNVVINDGDTGPAPVVSTVDPATGPQAPTLGGPGTPPTLPSGGGTIPKPGPLSGDVNLEMPTNAVETPSTGSPPATGAAPTVAPATGLTSGAGTSGVTGALGGATGAAGALGGATGLTGAATSTPSLLSKAVSEVTKVGTSAIQATEKSMLSTVVGDLAKGDVKDLAGSVLKTTAINTLKSAALSSTIAAATKSVSAPSILSGFGTTDAAATAAASKQVSSEVTKQLGAAGITPPVTSGAATTATGAAHATPAPTPPAPTPPATTTPPATPSTPPAASTGTQTSDPPDLDDDDDIG